MTASDVINPARRLLNDETETYRWPNSTLCDDYLNEGRRRIWARRPDIRLGSDQTLATFSDLECTGESSETLPTDEMTLSLEWRDALIDFVLSRALEEDSEDTMNLNRAKLHRDRFEKRLTQ